MQRSSREAVLLVGHGGVPSDLPREWLHRLKQLEGQRRALGQLQMGAEERELDERVRHWPRDSQNDPYAAGLERLARSLESMLEGRPLALAYNEFCAPSIEVAVAGLIHHGAKRVVVLTTMLTPGGHHSEVEIPEACERCRRRHPEIEVDYLWPFDLDRVASFLAQQLQVGVLR